MRERKSHKASGIKGNHPMLLHAPVLKSFPSRLCWLPLDTGEPLTPGPAFTASLILKISYSYLIETSITFSC